MCNQHTHTRARAHTHTHAPESGQGSDVCPYIFAAASTHRCLDEGLLQNKRLKNNHSRNLEWEQNSNTFPCLLLGLFFNRNLEIDIFIDFVIVCTAHIVLGDRSVLLGQTAMLHQRHGILHASYVVGCG